MKLKFTRKTWYFFLLAAAACPCSAALPCWVAWIFRAGDGRVLHHRHHHPVSGRTKGSPPRTSATTPDLCPAHAQLWLGGWAADLCSALVWPALLALEYQKGRPIQRQLQLVGAAEAFHLLFVLLTVYGGMSGLSFWTNLLWVLLACARGWAALSLYKMQEEDA